MQDYSLSTSEKNTPNFNRLKVLAEVINSTKVKRENFIKSRYEDQAADYDVSIGFFELLGFVKIVDGILVPQELFNKILNNEDSVDSKALRELVTNSILSDTVRSTFIDEFLILFEKVNDNLVLHLTTEERLKYSDIRNLFVELGLMHYITATDSYSVESRLVPKVTHAISRSKTALSAEQFAQLLADQSRIGEGAEMEILKYERKRLANYPALVDKIQHTALLNVRAGYDILSWEEPSKGSETSQERYIEVKAVSLKDFRFMWTTNEIENATRIKDAYFLYLVPVVSEGKYAIDSLEIIQDPYNNVFLDKKRWTKSENVYTIWKLS